MISDHAPNDTDLILRLNAMDEVVGVTIIGAAEAEPEAWFEHPDRDVLPKDIKDAVDGWFLQRHSAG